MTNIIYLDIDGTLRDEESGIPDSAVWAVNQCREQGIRIVICTGRNPGSIQEDVKELVTDGTIAGGGCYIQFHGEEFPGTYFADDLLERVFSMASDWELSLAVETKQQVYMDHNASVFYQEDFQHKISGSSNKDRESVLIHNKIAYEDNLGKLRGENREFQIHKICMFGRRETIDRAETELAPEAQVIQKKEWNGEWYLELLPKDCDKGSAIRWLNRKLGIPKSGSMSFGDSENDIAMMEATGIAVAVDNKNPTMRKYASSVCEAVTEDGIYKELLRRNMILPMAKERSR